MSGGTLPFRQFVLKVHSRCDLACDHCYVYEHADSSWRGRPKVIPSATVARAGERIAEHARYHALTGVRVILHGGEPLLAGAPRLGAIARQLRTAITPACALDLRIHTNGVRLNEEFCEVFLAEGVKVGISLDGDRAGNDRHRRYADGRSSYDQVLAALALLRRDRYRELWTGLLATIDLRNDPVATYAALAALGPPSVDFLLPHGTHEVPPPGVGAGTPYADWLAAVFDRWIGDERRVPVRLFESIVRTSRGSASLTESLGLEASDVAVIETDGTIEQADSIKVAYDGAPATGFDIFRHRLSQAAGHPGIRARQQGLAGLSATCRQCPVVTSCGGGLYAHRYRSANGFDNPSVYCADLEKIITHVQRRLEPVTSAAPPPPAHEMPGRHFDALAAGFGDGETMAYLISAQRSIGRALLRLLRQRARPGRDDLFLTGWELLVRLEREHPAALDRVLAHPYVRAWAQDCVRAGGDLRPLPVGAGHLAAITAAAAIRAGLPAEVTVAITGGYVHLPTIGRLRVGEAEDQESTGLVTAEITVGGTAFQVRAASGKWDIHRDDREPGPDWEPVRPLRAGGLTVSLEDTDPYRDCHQWPAAPRLSRADAARWQELFGVAAELIESAYPQYASALGAGLSTIMPLAGGPPGRDISAAARPAFGAVGVALPADGEILALLLIHEFQHVKLGAALDLFELCDPASERLFYAPWRDDLRPVEALLQGTYAHIGVTDYWRGRRNRADGDEVLEAAARFDRWRTHTAEAIETLQGSDALTPLGARFVTRLRATIEPWLGESVPAAAAAMARQQVTERRQQRQQAGGR